MVVLPDGSPGTIPATATDVLGSSPGEAITSTLSVEGVRRLRQLLDTLGPTGSSRKGAQTRKEAQPTLNAQTNREVSPLRRLRLAAPTQLALVMPELASTAAERWSALPDDAQMAVMSLLARMIANGVVEEVSDAAEH
jgi:hypothetical protein